MNLTFKHLLIGSLMTWGSHAPAATLLIGSYTDGDSRGVYRYTFDTHRGQIAQQPLQVVNAVSPSWLTLSDDQRHLFAVNEHENGQVSAFRIDEQGRLELLNQVASGSDEPTHASLSHDQRYLFVANYAVDPNPGGSLAVLPIARDGKLGGVVQQLSHLPSHVDPDRQVSPHVHALVSAPDGQHVYACDLGADKVFIYRYEGANPDKPLVPAAPPHVSLPPGSGPRHLVFNAKGTHAYLTLEMSGEVVTFEVREAALHAVQRLPLTERKNSGALAGGGLHLSSDNRFLYVTNRGTTNEIVVYGVNPDNGQLSLLQHRSVEGEQPREFTLDPSERFLLVANQHSDNIVVMRRDPVSGRLGETVQVFEQPAPSDLKFVGPH